MVEHFSSLIIPRVPSLPPRKFGFSASFCLTSNSFCFDSDLVIPLSHNFFFQDRSHTSVAWEKVPYIVGFFLRLPRVCSPAMHLDFYPSFSSFCVRRPTLFSSRAFFYPIVYPSSSSSLKSVPPPHFSPRPTGDLRNGLSPFYCPHVQ